MPFIPVTPGTATVIAGGPYGAPAVSGYKDLSTLRSELFYDLGSRTDIGNAQLDRYINDAYIDLATSLDIPEPKVSFAFTAVVEQPFYKLPSGVGAIRAVSVHDASDEDAGWRLTVHADASEWRMLANQKGVPRKAFREQGVLILWPMPDSGYVVVVDAKVEPVKLTDPMTFPIFSQQYHEPLLKLAKSKAWDSLQNDEKTLTSEAAASRLINRKTNAEAGTEQNMTASLRPVFTERGLRQLRDRTDREDWP